jgi:ABC-type transport system involved in multi-copper enzyme maturation permease subunit
MDNSFPKINGKSFLGSPFAFPDVWQTVAWNSSLLLLIPAILLITLITNEFTYKTHRQNVIDGWSRSQFVTVKLVEVFIFSVLVTIVVFLTTLAFGYFANKPQAGISVFKEVRFLGFFFVQMLSYTMIAFLISMLIKRAGLAIGVFFIYIIIETFIVLFSKNVLKINGLDFMPQEVTDLLIPQPYARKLLAAPDKLKMWESQIPTYLMVATLYLLAYCFIANWRFRKSDI